MVDNAPMVATASISLPLLDRVHTATPCRVRWEDMTGDERTRHCSQCNLNVHNLSAMTRAEAEAFLAQHFDSDPLAQGRRVCAHLFRRFDGTIMTADCPVGLAAVRAHARQAFARISTLIGLIALCGFVISLFEREDGTVWRPCQPFVTIARFVGESIRGGAVSDGGIVLLPSVRQRGRTR